MAQKPKSSELDVLVYQNAEALRADVGGVEYCFVKDGEYPAELLANPYVDALQRQGYFKIVTRPVESK